MKQFGKKMLLLIFLLTILSIFWSIAYFLMNYLYQGAGLEIHSWPKQIITSILGIGLLFLTMFVLTRFNKKMIDRRKEYLQSITDAMQQIATGDFNVSLAKIKGHDNSDDPLGNIIDHINYMAKELGAVESMRQEFISNISHEIQSPLTSISGFARALKSDKLTVQERDRYVTIIETESKRLSNISDNLLKLTYLEADKPHFNSKEYRLDHQLQRVVLASEPQWQQKGIDMKLHMKETWLNADEELMSQVWINLLNNAIKFTDSGGSISIKVITKRDKELIVMIQDTGIGISAEEKLHLFERFYKADKARNRNTSGSGLGLAIVKKILNLHEAAIQVESDEGGTTFSVSFKKDLIKEGVNKI